MNIVVKMPGRMAEVKEVEKLELADMQSIVGGYIEHVAVDTIDVDMWCNEEGKMNGLMGNVALVSPAGEVYDIVVGTVFFTSHNEDGETVGLTEEQSKAIVEMMNEPESIMTMIEPHTGVMLECPKLQTYM